jgi:hypothetical protein
MSDYKIQCKACDTFISPRPVKFKGVYVGTETLCSECRKLGRQTATEEEIQWEYRIMHVEEDTTFKIDW